MQKIAVIYMGGTFGCVGSPLSPMPAEKFLDQLQQLYIAQKHLHFFSAPSIKDSTEFTASDWLKLAGYLQQLEKQFQHFIIIHGTDTLSYACAFLHHIFGQRLHIILTGSQYPLLEHSGHVLHPLSDAEQNFHFAYQSMQTIERGVYLAFNQKIYLGHATYKQDTQHFSAFLGQAQSSLYPSSIATNLNLSDPIFTKVQKIKIYNYYFYPATADHHAQLIQTLLKDPPQILILQGFGSGNIPYSPQFKHVLSDLTTQGCWVILSSQVLFGALSQQYAVTSWLSDLNLAIDPHHSQADLYARAVLLYLQYGGQENWQRYWLVN